MHQRSLAVLLSTLALSSTCLAETGGKFYVHPETGRNCVTSVEGREMAPEGYVYIHFQNICDAVFSVSIEPADSRTSKGKGISRGSPSRPATMYITCKKSEGCERGSWSVR